MVHGNKEPGALPPDPRRGKLPRTAVSRALLMRSTALQAVALAVLSSPAAAQLAANTRPSGGQVTAGQASIGGNATTTLIQQTSQNAAIDWKTYNVGSGQTVRYAQPDATAITLNTVTTANPSQIAGKILANGQIIIVNQSGVVFAKGAQVDTAGLVVSTAGISTKDFMAGRLVFNQPGHPGASISNAGNITIRQAGLAALVAPQVANSGVITAKLGRVILAGATTHTLDLYGDGLVALNITGQVSQVSLNGKMVPALVTNTGTILAPGGTIVLTAAAADSVVTNLVSAGGTIAAPSVGTQTGRVLVQGIGGSVSIDGQVNATGTDTGTTGGQVVVNATGNVNVSSGALIDASGAAGGGVIAVGTTAARAIGGPSVHPKLTARTVTLAAGSRIQANATGAGQGGRITVLSTEKTSQLGNITATGGAAAGDGGWIEVSGKDLALGGIIDVGGAHGKLGSILFDPANILVGTFTGDGSHGSTLVIAPNSLDQYTGNVILDAAGTIEVNQAVNLSSKLVKTFQLEGDEGISIEAAINAPGIAVALKSATGSITENASGSITASSISATASGLISLAGQNVSTTIAPFASIGNTASGVVAVLNADGNADGQAATAANEIPAIPGLVSAGDVTVSVSGTTANATPNTLSVTGNIIGTDVALSVTGSGAAGSGDAFSQLSGTISALGVEIGSNSRPLFGPGTVQISTVTGNISLAGRVLTATPNVANGPSGSTTLTAQAGDITEAASGSIDTGTLTGGASGTGNQNTAPVGNANFAISAGNTISTITGFTTSGNLALEDDTGLVVGTVTATAGSIAIRGPSASGTDSTGTVSIAGAATAAGSISVSNSLGISESLGASVLSTSGGVALSTAGSITLAITSTLTGEESSAAGTAVALSAGTGISLGGTVTAGAISQAPIAYTGIADLSVSNGNIAELIGGSIRAGTLTGSALSTAQNLNASAGNADFAVSLGNTIQAVNSFTTTNGFGLEDDTGLIIGSGAGGTLAAGGSIAITGPNADADLPSGILVINESIKGGAGISLGNALGIAELASGSVAAAAGVTLTTDGAIYQQAGGTVSGAVASSSGTALVLTAGGTTDFNTYFAAAGLGTVTGLSAISGLSFAGTLQAGAPSGGTYTGSANLAASAGDVLEAASGSLRAGTLFGSAAGSGNALFDATSGNTVSALTSFSASGNFALEDDAGLTIGNLTSGGSIDVFGPPSGVPSSIMVLNGTISAPGSITLSNAAGITEDGSASVTSTGAGVTLTAASGAITQASGATITGEEDSSAGTAIALSAGTGISIAGTLNADVTFTDSGDFYSGTAALQVTNGNIGETAGGSVRAAILTGDALSSSGGVTSTAGNADFAVSAGNTFATLTGFTTSGALAVEDDTGLSVGNLTAGSSIAVGGPASGNPFGILVISGAVQGGASVSLANALGIAELASGSVTSTAGGVTLTSTGGAFYQQAGGTLGGAQGSSSGTALALNAGGATDFDTYLPDAAFGTVNGLSLNGALAAGTLSGGAYTGLAVFTASAGDIAEAAGASIHAGTLSGSTSGDALLQSTSGNSIGTITGFTATGNIAVVDSSGLTLGNVTGGGTISVSGPTGANPAGILVIDGTVSAPDAITLSNALGIAELTGGAISSTQAGVSLATSGAIDQQEGASISSNEASSAGTALSLTAGGTTDFTTYLPQAGIGSVSGIAFGGTLTAGIQAGGIYAGLANFGVTNGNIVESASGSLRAGTLTGSASGAGFGNAKFVAGANNAVATLPAFTTSGDFVLADDAQLQIGTLTAGGSIDISGPTGESPTGILSISGTVKGGGSVTLSNALGVAVLPGSAVVSTAGGVTLTSSGGALALPAGTVLSGGEASSSGTAIALTSGGTTDFNTYLPSAALGTISGVSFGGTITAGMASAAGFTGIANVTTLAGNLTESAGATLQAGTLTGSIGGFVNPENAPEGNALLNTSAGNTVGVISQFTAYGNVAIEDSSGVTAGNITAGGLITIFGPTGAGALPTGILSVTGTLSAPGDITLSNALGIAELAGAKITSTNSDVTLLTSGAFAQAAGAAISGGQSSASGTAVSITASGTTDFDTYLPGLGFGSISGISFGGTLQAGAPIGSAYTGAASLTVSAGQILEGTAGSLRAGTLSGAASGNALFSSASVNTVGTLSTFTTGGNFALEDNGLTVDSLTATGSVGINGPAGAAPTGLLVIAGTMSAGGNITLSNALGIAELENAGITTTLGGVTLTSSGGAIAQQAGATLSAESALSLSAGGSTGFATYLPAAGIGTVQGVAFSGTLQSGPLSGTIYSGSTSLTASAGSISEAAGAHILAGTLSGSASGSAELGIAAGNSLSVLAGFTTGGGFTLENDTALTVAGPVTAGTNIDIFSAAQATAAPGILIIAGSLTAASSTAGDGTITLSNGLGILETGTGAVQAGNALTLASGGAIVQLPSGIFRVTQADAASGVGTVSLSASGSTDFAPYAPYAAFGTVGGIDLGGVLSAGAGASAPGGTATLIAKAGGITETAPGAASATGSILAGRLTAQAGASGGTAYTIDLGNGLNTKPSNEIGTLFGTDATPFFASGSITIADNGTLFGPSGSPAVTLSGAITAQGSLTVGITGANLDISQPGALPISAGTEAVFRTTAGTLANGTVFTGSITQSSGTIEAPTNQIESDKAFDQAAGATLNASSALGITAGTSMALGGTLEAPSVSLAALQGDITEAAQGAAAATGVIQATSLSATAQAGVVALDTVSAAGEGNQIAQLGASSAAGGFTLVDGQGLTVTGAVRAGLTAATPSELSIVAPAIDITAGSLTIAPPHGTAPGILSLVADQFTFASAADVQTPGGLVALDLLNANGSTVFSVGTAGTNTVAPSSLQHIAAGTGTLAIGSLDGTLVSPQSAITGGWGIGSGGTVTAIDIGGGFDLQTGGAAKVLGLFSNGSIDASGGLTVSALYGIAADGTALLTGSNAISTLGVQTGSTLFGFTTRQATAPSSAVAFQLVDDAPLTVLGPVAAQQGAVNIAVVGTNGSAPGLTLGSALAGSGRISGTDIDLSATGAISQVAGTLNAFGAPHGTITLQSTAGGVSLGGTLATGTFAGRVFTLDASGAILLAADGGTVSEAAAAVLATGTLAAAASGDILLATGTNTVDVISPLTVGTLSLSGLTASGTKGIAFTDSGALLVDDGATLSAYGPAGTSGPGTGSITLSLTAGALTLGSASGATIAAPADITVTAPGGIFQTGGLIASGADVTLAAGTPRGAAGISQAGGTITASGSVSETATGPAGGSADILLTTLTLGQATTGSVIEAGQDVTLVSATGSFVLTGSSITGSNAITLDFSKTIDLSAGSMLAAPGTSALTAGTIVVASATGSILANGVIMADGIPGDVLLSAGVGDIAQSGTGSIDAGTLAAEAQGNISLAGNNQVSSVGSLGAVLNLALPQTLTLYGLAAGGAAGIVFDDLASLQIGPDTGAHAVIEASAPTASLTINELGSGLPGFGSLVIGGAGASSLIAGGGITLTSLGAIFQDAGTLQSLNADVGLVSSNGSVVQANSTMEAATSISISAGQDFDQTSSVITAGGSVAVLAGGAVQQSGSTIAAGTSLSVTTGVNASLNGQSSAFGDFTQIGSVMRAGTDLTIDSVSAAAFSGNLSQSSGSTLAAGSVLSVSSASGGFAQDSSVMDGTAGVNLSVLGDIASTNGVIESAGAANAAGLVSISSVTGSISSTGTGALIEAGLPGGTLSLSAFGSIVADQIIAGTLSGSAGGGIQMSGTNTISAITSLVAAAGPIDLTDQTALTLLAGGVIESNQGNVAIGSENFAEAANSLIQAAQTVSIASAGGMTLDGTVQGGTASNGIFGGAVALSAGSGGIDATGGVLLAGTLAASSAGQMDLSNAGNQIAEIGAAGTLTGLAATGALALTDAQSLLVADSVTGGSSVGFTIAPGAFTENPGVGISAPGALAINAGGNVSIGGSLASGPLTLVSGGSFNELAGAGITVTGTGTITAGQAVTIDGRIAISGAADITAATTFFEGTDGTISIPAPATLTAPGSVTLDGLVSVPGALTIIAGTDFSQGAGALITAGNTNIDAQTGAVTIDGTLTASGPLTITSGTATDEARSATIKATGTTRLTAGGAATIAGVLSATGSLVIASSTILEAPTADISVNGDASLTGGLAATIDGPLSVSGQLNLDALESVTEGQGASIAAGATSIIARQGAVTINGTLQTAAPLTITAGTDFTEAATGSILLNQNVGLSAPGAIHVQTVSISAGRGITVDGLVSYPRPLQFAAGDFFTEGATGAIYSGTAFGGISVSAKAGDTTIDGIVATDLGLTVTSGADIIVQGQVAGLGSTLVAGGSVSIPGTLTSSSGQTTIQAGSFIDLGGVLTTDAITLTSGTDVSIGGALTAQGPLDIEAGGGISIPGMVSDTGTTFKAGGAVSIGGSLTSDAASIRGDGIDIAGVLMAGATQLTSTTGVTIEGSVSAAGTLGISAGTDISQGAASSIAATTTADLLAPGTITLAGSLAAPGIRVGAPDTRDVVWDGNTILTDSSLHGPTKALNVLAPLSSGSGVFVQSAAFQQLGNSFVDPLTGTSATLQITIEGKGIAHFDQLTAPQAQLLLVLANAGFADGLIDVGGLNVYHTQGETPPQAANLFGVVGGHNGTAAAGVGFSHLNSNINYQINGCPIQSINCILLSPIVVPVVDPVTDYAEGTQRRRHQDDDALPNVGEEDY